MDFGAPENFKLIRGIRPRITGNPGDTMLFYIGSQTDPYETPTYGPAQTWTIGQDVKCDFTVSARYLAIKWATGTAYQARLDSYDVDVEVQGMW